VHEGSAQVREVEQQQSFVVGETEHQREHGLLRLVQFQHARKHLRTQLGDA
jgi:hypothetical protein